MVADTRERLLAAAERTVRAAGVAGLTLDAVARQAGVSKGGLLHHFPSKDALIEALLRDLLEAFEQRVAALAEAEEPGPGRWLRAYVRASFQEEPIGLEFGLAVLHTLTQQETARALLREDAVRWRERLLSDGVPAARAVVVRQAADAAWLDRLGAPAEEDPAEREAVEQELLRLSRLGSW